MRVRISLIALFWSISSFGQVVFVGATPGKTADLTASANTLSFSQTLSAQSNRLLLIGISLNINQSATSQVTSITDNGASITNRVGAANDSGNKVRIELWSLTAPPTGANNIVITVSVSSGTVGAVAASGYFAQVNQTIPFEVFGSAQGQGGTEPSVTVVSAAGEDVIDTVATFGNISLTPGSGQTEEWQASSGGTGVDATGAGSIKAGATPTVTMNWTRSSAQAWAMGAVSIRPSILTAIQVRSFEAERSPAGTALRWHTARESQNAGFNVYREENGQRVQLNPSLIAGSALLMEGSSPQHTAKTYTWLDASSGMAPGIYWLEDVDLNGNRTLHGPVSSAESSSSLDILPTQSLMVGQLNQAQPGTMSFQESRPLEKTRQNVEPTSVQRLKQFELAAHPAVKIFVNHEGWYRVTQPELLRAGLNRNADPRLLHLYAEANEQPIEITGAKASPGGFGPGAAITFYGTGIDTPYSGTRVYWLVEQNEPGRRIPRVPPSSGSNQPPRSFPFTVELRPHTTYFAALITSEDGNNFFGSLVSSTPIKQSIYAPHFDKSSSARPRLEVILQGVIRGVPHDVAVSLNGIPVSSISFTGQNKGQLHLRLTPEILQEGFNTITFTAQGGEYDTSLVQSVQITYPHLYNADADRLKFTGRAGEELRITGFTNPPAAVLDITDPERPVKLTPRIASGYVPNRNEYAFQVQVPWSASNSTAGVHTLLAMTSNRIASVVGITANHPSHWHDPQPGGDIVMVSYRPFGGALRQLVAAHHSAGKSSAVVMVDNLYDEFNFGEHSPHAIRDFLREATKAWSKAPRYLLLNGRASVDPRNYLGFGELDFVPTMIVPTPSLMTASDDWFSDFSDKGLPAIATGRFPVGTLDEAKLVAEKVAVYEGDSTNGPWTSKVLMVADVNDTENFTQDSKRVQAQMPSNMLTTQVFASELSIATARQKIVGSISSGQLLVNFVGHGSEEQWSGHDLFDNTAADTLSNGSSLPVFLIMDCLNGLFQDVYEQPLAVKLMLVPNGGGVAVLASSGLNQPTPQTNLDRLVVRKTLLPPHLALGDAIVEAKSQIADPQVSRTYNLLGDPAMEIKRGPGATEISAH